LFRRSMPERRGRKTRERRWARLSRTKNEGGTTYTSQHNRGEHCKKDVVRTAIHNRVSQVEKKEAAHAATEEEE